MARLRANPLRSPSSPRSQSSLGPDSRSDSRESTALPACDIFNTTFLLYRASPLFVGADGLSDGRLQALEAQLRDTLAGGVVRGIEVGSDEDGDRDMVNAGTLEAVSVKWFSAHNVVSTPRPALQVTLQYENAQCMAVLLPPPETSKAAAKAYARPDSAFVNLPLLLFRMPVPLKDTVVRFLSSTFDCRIIPLHLSRGDIIRSWELWARATALPTTGPLARDAVLTLCFNLPEPGQGTGSVGDGSANYMTSAALFKTVGAFGSASSYAADSTSLGLKMMDVIIPNADLRGFLEAGQQLELGHDSPGKTPFTTALSLYLRDHLGLEMSNPAVEVVRVACGGFVLATNRVKIFGSTGTGSEALGRHRSSITRIIGSLALRASGCVREGVLPS